MVEGLERQWWRPEDAGDAAEGLTGPAGAQCKPSLYVCFPSKASFYTSETDCHSFQQVRRSRLEA